MNDDLLEFARAWKAGYTLPVHPSVARRLNQALVANGEDAVPFRRATNETAPSLDELLRRAHQPRQAVAA